MDNIEQIASKIDGEIPAGIGTDGKPADPAAMPEIPQVPQDAADISFASIGSALLTKLLKHVAEMAQEPEEGCNPVECAEKIAGVVAELSNDGEFGLELSDFDNILEKIKEESDMEIPAPETPAPEIKDEEEAKDETKDEAKEEAKEEDKKDEAKDEAKEDEKDEEEEEAKQDNKPEFLKK